MVCDWLAETRTCEANTASVIGRRAYSTPARYYSWIDSPAEKNVGDSRNKQQGSRL